MDKTVLYANLSAESREAKKALAEAGIEYIPILNDSDDAPFLLAGDSTFPYEGLARIKDYCDLNKKVEVS